MKIFNCFCTDSPNTGNPAGIIFDFPGDKAEKQKLAHQLQLPVTVFIDRADSLIPVLYFFYPDIEMNVCLHGALAAVFILLNRRKTQHITVSNAIGTLFEAIKLDNNIVQIKVSAESPPAYTIDPVTVVQLLNLVDFSEVSQDLPLTVASVGSPKLLVPLKSLTTLAALHPDFDFIKKWSFENRINGLYIYVQDSSENNLFSARAFNPKTGQNEDAATGVAGAALALALKKNIIIKQGQFMDRPSMLIITYHTPEEIYVGGRIVEQNGAYKPQVPQLFQI